MLLACSSSATVEPTKIPTNTNQPTIELTKTQPPTDTITPTETITDIPATNTRVPSATSETITANSGLDISRIDAARMFMLYEFIFEGEDVYTGTVNDNLAVVTIIGQKDNINSISIKIYTPVPPSSNQASRTMLYLATMLTVGAENWEAGTDWLNENLNKMGESTTSLDDRDVILVLTPTDNMMTIELTIKSK